MRLRNAISLLYQNIPDMNLLWTPDVIIDVASEIGVNRMSLETAIRQADHQRVRDAVQRARATVVRHDDPASGEGVG